MPLSWPHGYGGIGDNARHRCRECTGPFASRGIASSGAPQGVPVQPPPPARWREAPNQVFHLHGWDTRGEGHRCAVHELGRVYDVTRDHSTALEQQCEEVVRRVQARLPYATAGGFVVLPPTELHSRVAATRGAHQRDPRSQGMRECCWGDGSKIRQCGRHCGDSARRQDSLNAARRWVWPYGHGVRVR